MLFISKKTAVSTHANLAILFICELFQSSLQVSLSHMAFPPVLVSSFQDDCRIYYECAVLGSRLVTRGDFAPLEIFLPSLDKCVGHTLKNLAPAQKTLCPPGVTSWLRGCLADKMRRGKRQQK